MNKKALMLPAVLLLIIAGQSNVRAEINVCERNDALCREFAALSETGQFGKIVQKVHPQRTYSDATRGLIGKAYLAMADSDQTKPEQKEQFYGKAIAYGSFSAYMGLYAIHAKTDGVKALELLKQYIATGPEDPAPYVLLGEAEFNRGNYRVARDYLKEGKKVARGNTANIDWLLFEASYLSEEYGTASAMLDSSFSQGKTVGDLKALVSSDERFSHMGKRSEFRKFFNILNGTATPKTFART
jgi:hypothetical protein